MVTDTLTPNTKTLIGLHQTAAAVTTLEEARDIYRSLQTEVSLDQAEVLALLERA